MLNNLLNAANIAGYTMLVECDGETDYEGQCARDAMDAIEAVDEATVFFLDGIQEIGSAYIVNGLDEDEHIADCSGWVERWLEQRALMPMVALA